MKTIAAALLALTFTLCAPAQVAVYKQKVSRTSTGGGFSTKTALTGYLVWDLSSGRLVRITVAPQLEAFQVLELSDHRVNTVTGAGKDYTVFTQAISEPSRQDSEMTKGQNSLQDIGESVLPTVKRSLPKTMTITARSIWPKLAGVMQAEEYSGTLVLDLKETQMANMVRYSVDQEVAMLKLFLIGLTEIP